LKAIHAGIKKYDKNPIRNANYNKHANSQAK
jgi:hypothetical protein